MVYLVYGNGTFTIRCVVYLLLILLLLFLKRKQSNQKNAAPAGGASELILKGKKFSKVKGLKTQNL